MAETTVNPIEPDNLVLAQLRAIRGILDDHTRKFDEVIDRLGRVEREVANLHGDFASLSTRLDTLDRRVARIERAVIEEACGFALDRSRRCSRRGRHRRAAAGAKREPGMIQSKRRLRETFTINLVSGETKFCCQISAPDRAHWVSVGGFFDFSLI
jgi:hypothetical protein